MRLRLKLFFLIFVLGTQNLLAQPSHSESISDPTAMTETLTQGLNGWQPSNHADASKATKPPLSNELSDPTQMNMNFRTALERAFKAKTTVNGAATSVAPTAPLRPALPKISLVANLYNANQTDNHAMLRINEQTKLVGMGDKFNIIDNNQLIEIEVIDIGKKEVKVRLTPSNETLILR